MKKAIIITFLAMLAGIGLSAQAPTLQSVKEEMYKINKVFDSSRYLGFEVNIRYTSDTVYGKFDYEEMNGKYILNDRNVYYKMDNIEYVQNDSFAYNIYHDEKMLMMTRDSIRSKSSLFPLKEFVDSVVTWYSNLYSFSVRDEDDSKVIEFTATDTLAPYKRFAIYYEPESHYPDKIEMYFIEGNDVPVWSSVDEARPTKKLITMSFSNYYNVESLAVFDDTNYIFFDRLHQQYRPSEKYKSYKFISNGVGGNEYDESVEMYPPPEDNQ